MVVGEGVVRVPGDDGEVDLVPGPVDAALCIDEGPGPRARLDAAHVEGRQVPGHVAGLDQAALPPVLGLDEEDLLGDALEARQPAVVGGAPGGDLVLVGAQGHLDAGQGPGVVEAGGVHEVLVVAALVGQPDVADDQGLGGPAVDAHVASGRRVGVVVAAPTAASLAVVPADLLGAGGGSVEHVLLGEAQLHQEQSPFPLGDEGPQVELVLQPGVALIGDLEGVEGDPHADAARVVEGAAALAAAGQALALQERPQVGGEDLLHRPILPKPLFLQCLTELCLSQSLLPSPLNSLSAWRTVI